MRLRRALLLAVVGGGLVAAGPAYAQVPPTGAGPPGWLNAIFNVLGDGVTSGGPRTQITAGATGTTAGATASLAGAAGKTTFICGLSVAPGSATTAITINITTTGLTNNFTWSVGAPVTAVGVTGSVLTVPITPCEPASAVNTAITVVAGALGAGGVNQDVNAWGYQR